MSNDNDTPESVSEPEVEGVDPDDLANLEVDPDELDEEGAGDGEDGDGVGEDGDDTLAGAEIADGEAAAESEVPATTDEDRLNLVDVGLALARRLILVVVEIETVFVGGCGCFAFRSGFTIDYFVARECVVAVFADTVAVFAVARSFFVEFVGVNLEVR
ncbi:MAG: hypothetical protein ACKPAJ_04905, partial [Actinomycetota bacterium]